MSQRTKTARHSLAKVSKKYNDLFSKGWIPAKNATPRNQNKFLSVANDTQIKSAKDSLGEAEGVAVGIPMYIAAVAGAGIAAASGASLPVVFVIAAISGAYGGTFGLLCARQVKRYHDAHVK